MGGIPCCEIPLQTGRDDGAILKEVAHKVADIYTSADTLVGVERKEYIRNALKTYESGWS